MMFNYQCLCLFGLLFVVQAILDKDDVDLVVEKIPKFPFIIGKAFDITIVPKEVDGSLSNSISDALVIQIRTPTGTVKETALVDFGFREKIDSEFKGKFVKVVYWSISEDNKLFVALTFSSLANNLILEIYHLKLPFAPSQSEKLPIDLKPAKNLYRSNITLDLSSKIEITVNNVVNSTFQLLMGSTVDAVCRTFIPSKINPSFQKIKNMKVLKKLSYKSKAKLQFLATIAVHGKNLTCQIGNTKKAVNLQVLHVPTKVIFKPGDTNMVVNGTDVICLAADGFPIPKITWHFIDGPKNASQFYKISPCKKRLVLSGKAPTGSLWKFNCSSMNDILGTKNVYYKSFKFIVVHKMPNNTIQSFTRKPGYKIWNVTENSDNNSLLVIRRTISNHSRKINKLDANYVMIKHEMSKWKTNEKLQKLEFSKMKKHIELLKVQVKDQNIEIQKLKNNLERQSKSRSDKVVSKENESATGSTPTIHKPIAIYEWTVSGILRLRQKRKTVHSQKMVDSNLPFPIKFWLLMNSRSTLLITLYMYPLFKYQSTSLPMSGITTMTIYNAENPSLYRSMVRSFTKTEASLSLDFAFDFYELFSAKVLHSDEIVIKFSVGLNSAKGPVY